MINFRFEILYKIGNVIHKASRMYHQHQEGSAAKEAEIKRGKVRDTVTGKIIYDFCPKSKKEKYND